VDSIQARIDVETLKPFADQPQGAALQANDLAQVSFALHEAVFIDMAPTGARLGIGSRCLLIDEATDITVGAGVLRA
jgi:sulfate adenylyltransferase subunit 1 (EFTu-like GTPase family)